MPGGHIQMRFAGVPELDAAAVRFTAGVADREALTLRIPGDGRAATLRSVLAALDGVPMEELTVHTPDLDDVFLNLTGGTR
jgi:ABC-2 type transport system ATP-binding protein